MSAVLEYLPRGNTLSDEEWHRRHKFLQWILAGHLPALFIFGVWRGYPVADVAETLALPLAALIVGHLLRSRRLAAAFITLGLVYCSAALVGFSNGAIEAHFHFFIMIGFIALYQDWVPFLLNIGFTVLSHGIGSSLVPDLMFSHKSAQDHPWEWSLIHGVAVLAACVGVVVFWKNTEDEQNRTIRLREELAEGELTRRRFTSELLVNLARRNQNLLYRQLDLLNDLEDKERDPDALADLFRLDHLATRIRRNAESLLVLSGEESPRTWREPVQLVDVIRAAIAEIEDLDRVDDAIDETLAVSGRTVADLTHLFAELLENAVHFSPPGVPVVVRSRPVPSSPGIHLITIEDWGVGMTPQELAEANDTLRAPREVDLSVSQRLGLHVVARLAHRYGITVELTSTPGGGVTAVAVLPPAVFERSPELIAASSAARNGHATALGGAPSARPAAVGVVTPPTGTPAVRTSFGGPPAGLGGGPVNGTAVVRSAPVAGATRAPAGFDTPAAGPGVPQGGPGAGAGAGSVSGAGVRPGSLGSPVDGRPGGATRAGDVADGPAGTVAPGPDGITTTGRTGQTGPTGIVTGPTGISTGPTGIATGPTGIATGPAGIASGPAGAVAPVADGPTASAAAGPATPVRPVPPLPAADLTARPPVSSAPPVSPASPAPAGDRAGFSLPRRGPGESLARTPLGRPASPDAPTNGNGNGRAGNGAAADRNQARNQARSSLGGAFAGTAAGGDGAVQPGYSGPRPFGELSDGSENWSSWWTRAAPVETEDPSPAPEPGPRRPEPNGAGGPEPLPLPEPRPPADDGPQLRRRVPQAHLAAGLRRETEQQTAPAEENAVVRDPMTARNALSRFQAAQRAARDQVEGDHPEGPSR